MFEVGVVPSPATLLLGEDVLLRLLLLFVDVDEVVTVAVRGPLVQWEQHQLGDMGLCSKGGEVQLTWYPSSQKLHRIRLPRTCTRNSNNKPIGPKGGRLSY